MTTTMSSKETNLENRLTKLEETDKHILEKLEELSKTSVTKVEHAHVLSQISDLQDDFDGYKDDSNKKLEAIFSTLNGLSSKIAMYVGGTIVAGAVFGFVIWAAKEVLSPWLQGR